MDWSSTFRKSFFAEWSRQGLAEFSPTPGAEAGWPAVACPLLADVPPGAVTRAGIGRGLDPRIVNAVYGFGVFVGEVCGRLHGVEARTIRARAKFCGQFNLGISLFDLVCDEGSAADRAALKTLPSLRMFTGARTAAAPDCPTLAFLDRVAAAVLTGLADELGPAGSRPSGLWRAMFAMFGAQVARADANTTRLADAGSMRKALRLSSAEPFRVMSEWMARRPGVAAPTLRQAAYLGRCIGDCYWLIDDARDVWDDLHAGRWNRFLLDAKAAEPALRLDHPTPFVEARLTQIWDSARTAERASKWAVGRLARTLQRRSVNADRSHAPLARIHASMLRWYG